MNTICTKRSIAFRGELPSDDWRNHVVRAIAEISQRRIEVPVKRFRRSNEESVVITTTESR